jgi:hypothetical protein
MMVSDNEIDSDCLGVQRLLNRRDSVVDRDDQAAPVFMDLVDMI